LYVNITPYIFNIQTKSSNIDSGEGVGRLRVKSYGRDGVTAASLPTWPLPRNADHFDEDLRRFGWVSRAELPDMRDTIEAQAECSSPVPLPGAGANTGNYSAYFSCICLEGPTQRND
jgi:hypothetical protein